MVIGRFVHKFQSYCDIMSRSVLVETMVGGDTETGTETDAYRDGAQQSGGI